MLLYKVELKVGRSLAFMRLEASRDRFRAGQRMSNPHT